ncbi:MAG TPA: substrate-binding domain-containing protein, partial [Aggregatilineales bacterium]|nr:substrate-binding domain-containing protein [Aggregatilineales bacterium]
TMKRHKLSSRMSVEGNWSAQSGYEGLHTLIKAGAKFTGLVVANDQMALGAIAALNELGLRVPEDVSVVGFDDIPESGYFLPALTTVHQDFMALGQQCVEYLVSLITNPDTPVHQRVLYPKLVVRSSTAPH